MPSFYDSSSRRVLVVEDEPKLRDLVTRQLRSLGYRADAAGTAAHAQVLAAAHSYDLVLTDLRLPGIDGTQLIAEIARACPLTGFVMMTGAPALTESGRVDGRIIGVLRKPFDKPTLAETVARAFEVVEKRRQLAEQDDAPVNVLLLEDDEADAALTKRALTKLGGFECFHVSRLAEAVESTHNCKFDTIITDLSLPDARGLDAVVKLRRSAPEATFIVLSGSDDEALALRVLELGVQDFIIKGQLDVEGMGRAIRFARVRRKGEQQLARLAYSDALTGLWNRTAFAARLDEALAEVKRHNGSLGVIYIDLDGFKAVNDKHGHDAGDHLLLQVASRLKDSVREYDSVARLGGDEFAVLATHQARGALFSTAERIGASLAIPIAYREHVLRVTASIGLAAYPEHASDSVLLLKLADDAMYQSKRSGKNQIQSPETAARLKGRGEA